MAAAADVDELRAALGGPLPDGPSDPTLVLDELVAAADPGVVAIPSGRYFGFVIGGALPASLAADWLTSVWDQNAGLVVGGPAAAVVEEVAGSWLKDLLGLPTHASFALVTGCQMAHVTCLAAARHHVLAHAGWDAEGDGLTGAPRVHVLAGEERHVTVDRALRLLGLGNPSLVPVDRQGRMRPDALRMVLAEADGPTIVCAQAGDVNTGAIDELPAIAEAAHEAGAWLHVDGAFGLWAAASPSLRGLVAGADSADSWATDAHKWLNVPYDSGLAFVAHPESHRAAMAVRASYLVHAGEDGGRDAVDYTPEFSRRARGFAVYAGLRSLGRKGIAELVDDCCAHARRFAERLEREPGVEILNEVVLNQVLVRFHDPGGDHDGRTAAVVRRVQEDGVLWLGGTTWRGVGAMRISVSNWSTTEEDVDRSVDAILAAASAHHPRRRLAVAIVLVDGENVRRSRWPNIGREQLVELVEAWASEHSHEAVVVFDGDAPAGAVGSGAESADDWLVRRAAELADRDEPYWLVTSDRALRAVAGARAERTIGGGGFAGELGV